MAALGAWGTMSIAEGKQQRRRTRRRPRHLGRALLLATGFAAVGGFFWIVSAYEAGLRDPRYLDGWVLVCVMALQLSYHVALKARRLSPDLSRRWRALHIASGVLLIPAFISHAGVALPDAIFEWALWGAFIAVVLSGILGASLPALQRRNPAAAATSEGLAIRRAELARTLHELVTETPQPQTGLPAPPYQSWIADLYRLRLQKHFGSQRNAVLQLLSVKRSFSALTEEIDDLSRYVDPAHRRQLDKIKLLLVDRRRLDAELAFLSLSRCWQSIHVPMSYALVVLIVFHIIVVYAFSSGSW